MVILFVITPFGNVLQVQAASTLSSEREQIYALFGQDAWEQSDESAKQLACTLFVHDLCQELSITPPIIVFDKLNHNVSGKALFYENKIIINTDLYGIGPDALSTCAHEIRHVWQTAQINNETDYGKQFLNARNNYIDWDENFIEYENNLLEKDAFAYAMTVSNQFFVWSYNMQHPENKLLFQPVS